MFHGKHSILLTEIWLAGKKSLKFPKIVLLNKLYYQAFDLGIYFNIV